jgi:spore coat polysaccharide biosynthesis protein SpsF
MKNKTGIILYARMSSRRLPGKVLKKINNQTLIEIIFNRIRVKFPDTLLIVNTSIRSDDNEIVNLCKKRNIKYFRGSLKNVFKRTVDCCEKFNLKYFARICCDRPIVDSDEIKKMFTKISTNEHKYDIITNQFPKNVPKGLGCEISKVSIFKKINTANLISKDKEHIFDFFYRNNKKYKILNTHNSYYKKLINKDYTIDTIKDYNKFKKIFKKINYNFLLPTKSIIKKINMV